MVFYVSNNIDWTDEELTNYLNRPEIEIMKDQIADAYESLSKAINFTQTDVASEDFALPLTKDKLKLLEVFGHIQSALLMLGNWIDNDKACQIHKDVKNWLQGHGSNVRPGN